MKTFFNKCGLILALLVLASLFFGPVPARADSFGTPDKPKHAAVSMLLGQGAAALTKGQNDRAAFALAMAPGLAKELYDMRPGGSGFSWRDLVADAVGAYAGVKLGGLMIRRNFIGYTWRL